jgi:manganese/iron transport system permease protein
MIHALSYKFVQHALMAAVIGGAGCGVIGVWVVLLRIPFIGVAMSHAAFAGAIVGLLVGVSPLFLGLVACIGAAALVGPAADRTGSDPNLSLGVIFSILVGIAFLGMGLMKGPKSEALSLLWGNILTLSASDIRLLALATLAAVAFSVVFYHELRAIIFSRLIARSTGIHEKELFYALLLICGTTITLNLNTIGGLLIFSLIVNPPSAAYQITYNLARMLVYSALFAIAACLIGLVVSYLFNAPTGAVIVLVSGVILLVSVVLSPKRRRRRSGALEEAARHPA